MFLTGVTLLGSLALLGALAIYATPRSMTASQDVYLSPLIPEPAPILHTYVEVASSCGPYHNGTCAIIIFITINFLYTTINFTSFF
jgi:hypothetical protein